MFGEGRMSKSFLTAWVLCLASLAGADLSLEFSGNTAALVSDNSLAYVAWIGWSEALESQIMDIGLTPLVSELNLSAAEDYGFHNIADYCGPDLGRLHMIEITVASSIPEEWDIQPGVHYTVEANSNFLSEDVTGTGVYLITEDLTTVLGAAYLPVPEPATVMLLGLGGLVLRKRKLKTTIGFDHIR
jgi:hypothetical protein